MADTEKKPNAQVEFLKGLFGADGEKIVSEDAVLDAIDMDADGDTQKELAFRRLLGELQAKGLLKIEYALTEVGQAHVKNLDELIEITRSDSGAFNPYSAVDVEGLTARVHLDEGSTLLTTTDPAEVAAINKRLKAGESLREIFSDEKP